MKNLKKYSLVLILLTILTAGFFIINSCNQSIANKNVLPTTFHPATDAYDGWRLGSQAYTFNRFTFF